MPTFTETLVSDSSNTALQFIPLCVPEIKGNEWTYLKECLDTAWVSTVGSFVDRFENKFAPTIGTKAAVATASGTAALHIALLVADIQPGDEVIVSSLTFIAPANAIRYVQAWPVFIDAEPEYFQMDIRRLQEFLEEDCDWNGSQLTNRRTGRHVRAILPVHILGHPVDMDPLLELARKYGLAVIEDATESLGASYRGRSVGSLGDIACFSFNGNKLITTGGGGMIVTDRLDWAAHAKYLTTQAKDDPVEFVHGEIGYNYRLTNIQAAIGCAQLEMLADYIQAKRAISARYERALSAVPGIRAMSQASWASSVYWMYTVLVDENAYGIGSRALLKQLEGRQIQTRPLWQPLHRSPAHTDSSPASCPVAEQLARQALSLPCSVGLSKSDQERVISAIVAVSSAC